MKLTRVILACTLLLLFSLPSFAAPPCKSCVEEGVGPCDFDPNSGLRCRTTGGSCETYGAYCINLMDSTVLTEWNVASIEVTCPAEGTKTVTTPAVVASAETPQLVLQK